MLLWFIIHVLLQVYETYKDYGVIEAAVAPVALYLVYVVVGTFGNINVILATCMNKTLRSTCHWLIAMSSFFDTARLFANIFLAYELFSGKNFVDMRTCYFYISIPFMGVICARLILLLTGLDRLLRVLLPVAYNRVTQPVYLTFVCSLCAFITAFFLSHGYVNSANNPDKPVICVTTAALPPLISAIYGRYAIGSTIATVVCYVTLWWCVRRKRGTSSEMDTLQKGLFKSLSYIVVIVVVCWGTASAFTFLTPWLGPIAAFFLELYSGLFVNLGCCCNYFVLYRCSATYRDTFRHQFRVCVRLARPSSVDVVVVSSMPSKEPKMRTVVGVATVGRRGSMVPVP